MSELTFTSVSKRVLVHNLSYENHSNANQSYFHLNGCTPELVLKQRQIAARKWPIEQWKVKDQPKVFSFLLSAVFDYGVNGMVY